MVNAMLISSELSLSWWGEAILSACYILNRVPLKKIGLSPYELWFNRKPNLKHLKVWGCLAYVRIPDPKRPKLGCKTYRCAFIGYSKNSITYRFLNLDTFNIIESIDVEFFENMNKSRTHNKLLGDSNIPSNSLPVDSDMNDTSENSSPNSHEEIEC